MTRQSGPMPWWRATDPRGLALAHLALAAVALVLGATLALLTRAEFLVPTRGLLDRETYGQMVSLHGAILMVFCAAPAMQSVFGNLLLPRMLGARELAWPELGRWSMRMQFVGLCGALLASLVGSLDGGWWLLPPWSTTSALPAVLMAVSMHLLALSMIGVAINHLATLLGARIERGIPLFARIMGVSAGFTLVVATALGAGSVLLLAEATGRADLFGHSVLPWVDLFAFFGRGVVILGFCGAVGLVFLVSAAAARKEPHAPTSTTIALALTGTFWLLGNGLDIGSGSVSVTAFASGLGLLAAVPATVLAMNFLATLQGGAIRVDGAFLLGLVSAVSLCAGGVAGLFLVAPMTGEYLRGTAFATAQLHLVLAGGGLAAFLGGMVQLWPELVGGRLRENRVVAGAVLIFAGLMLGFLPLLVLGSRGLALRSQVLVDGALEPGRLAATGSLVLFAGLILISLEFLKSILAEPVPADPEG